MRLHQIFSAGGYSPAPVQQLWMFNMGFAHHEMPPPGTFGGTNGLGGADGVGGTGENNVMYAGEPKTDVEKMFGMQLPPDARAPRTSALVLM
eukprot:CAMPEP_0181313682 /NCGR_PEP_ID=MMETSP1101-20121128/14382_1 /TAXON_ID=46948 /ORGANISM="Rhodomonas abbreviata, Strain Caron Lab Isolate" /LENGTH=91 /DNA_ID=CAMNT_0023420659 /DNA_START=22 /DNA_END=297 /DNA_ORIENTATION=+